MNDEFKNVEQQLLKTMLKFDMISNSKFYRTEDTVQVRVARLLILLNSIEEQLLLIKNNLKKYGTWVIRLIMKL